MESSALPFGRLLIDPYCTRSSIYIISIFKALITVSQSNRTGQVTRFKAKAFRQPSFGKEGREDFHADSAVISRLLEIFERSCLDEDFYQEAILLILTLLIPSDYNWRPFFLSGIQRPWSCGGPSAFIALDELLQHYSLDIFKELCSLHPDSISSKLFEALNKVLSSRFDDNFGGAWEFVFWLDKSWLRTCKIEEDADKLISYVSFFQVLYRLERSEKALDCVMNLVDILFACKFNFNDEPFGLISAIADLVLLFGQYEGSQIKTWMHSSISSNIRRMVPIRPPADGNESVFSNLTSFAILLCPNNTEESLINALIAFVKRYAEPRGLSRNADLCRAYISVSLNPRIATGYDQLAGQILADILEGSEGPDQLMGGDDVCVSALLIFFLDSLCKTMLTGRTQQHITLVYQGIYIAMKSTTYLLSLLLRSLE